MDRGTLQTIQVLVISVTLLALALVGARAHAGGTQADLVGRLQEWKQEVRTRAGLSARERDMRVDFIDRLIFQSERKYRDGSWSDFLQKALGDMAETDDLALNQSFGSSSVYLTDLQESLKSLLERNEDPIAFLQTYTDFSSLSSPKDPDDFANTRDYSNGKSISSANPMDLEEAANWVDQKEKEAATPSEIHIFKQTLLEDLFFPGSENQPVP